MLTPSKEDPNRAAELKRMKDDPLAFGTTALPAQPRDWKEVPLVVKTPKAETPKAKK